MANTERFNTLQKVVLARKEVNKLRQAANLKPAEANLLDTAYTTLIDIEDLLILEDIQDSIKAMQAGSEKLAKLTADFEKAAARLKKIAKLIGVAAKALGTLADIAAKAASAGIA